MMNHTGLVPFASELSSPGCHLEFFIPHLLCSYLLDAATAVANDRSVRNGATDDVDG